MKNLILTLFIAFTSTISFAQAPAIQWQKCLGGSDEDIAQSIRQTTDGGYIVGGTTLSNDGNVSGNHGNSDIWVTKLNDTGAIQWKKCLGGSNVDGSISALYKNAGYVNIIQTNDGGYIVASNSGSTDGDVTGLHGGQSDCWVVKLNDTGAIQWKKTYGGGGNDYSDYIQQTFDGGYIIAATSNSNDGDVTGHHGPATTFDYWIVKLNDTGAIEWQKSLGGAKDDIATYIQQTSDSGYIVAGYSSSNDGDVTGNHDSADYWIVKLSSTGSIQWEQSYGGTSYDQANSIRQTKDGGYIVAGTTVSNDGNVSGNHGTFDCWILKLSYSGSIEWQKCLGGSYSDNAFSVFQSYDSGYIVAGCSTSIDGDVTGNHGGDDYWIIKLSSSGSILWEKSYGGNALDLAYDIQPTSDGNFIVAGFTYSTNGDVTGNHGYDDYWIVKLTCGLNAGLINGLSSVCKDSTITLTDTTSGGTWSSSNTHASISGRVVTAISAGTDTIFYSVKNTCSIATASFPITVISCPTEVNIINNNAPISIIPNPTTGAISITGTNNVTIKVYNTIGQLIKSATNTGNISISEYPAGLYFVRVFDEQGTLLKQEKVIKNP